MQEQARRYLEKQRKKAEEYLRHLYHAPTFSNNEQDAIEDEIRSVENDLEVIDYLLKEA